MFVKTVRGAIDINENEEEPYKLYVHPAKKFVEKERFADWMALKQGPDYTALKKEIQNIDELAHLEEALDKLAEVVPDAQQLRGNYSQIKKEKLLGLINTTISSGHTSNDMLGEFETLG